MKRKKLRSIVCYFYVVMLTTSAGWSACSTDVVDERKDRIEVSQISLPLSLDIMKGNDWKLEGTGFLSDDLFHLSVFDSPDKIYQATVKSVADKHVTIALPDDIKSGKYRLSLARGEKTLSIGTFFLNITLNLDIPDKAGMTVKGVVYCNGSGVPGVVVSDGIEVTTTDNNGIYYLPSQKKHGYVFISVPGNYEVESSQNIPRFFQRLSAGTQTEQKNFSLVETDNSRHIVITMADMHLANRNNDITQFETGFMSDVAQVVAPAMLANTKVYGLTLGDMSWDVYWYDNKYALPEYMTQLAKIGFPVFNIMGNHDNDPYEPNDFTAEQAFKNTIGPSYYSFNLGNAHYVVLDNTEYINKGGAPGVIGDRSYNGTIVAEQLAWLEKDLASIKDKNAPLFIAMHIQLHANPSLSNGEQVNRVTLGTGSQLLNLVKSYPNVHFLTGHTHINYTITAAENIMEHNTAAVCATWWWTGKNGYAGNHISKDGSPGGYGIWETDGNDTQWLYKGIGFEKNYQFRSYDLNQVHITAEKFAPKSTDEKFAPYVGSYGVANTKNEVLLNIWGYDDQWKIEVTENGNPLAITRISDKDPLHIISYEAFRLNAGATPTDSFVTCATAHLFKVTASSPASTLDIKVTDRFGNVYTETMTRPKAFDCAAK